MKLLLRDLQAGQNYKVQVRANDGQAVSDWSIVYDITTDVDNVAPGVPTSFSVVQEGTTNIVTWVAPSANTDGSLIKDFSYYEVEAYSDGVTSNYRTGIERFEFNYEYNLTAFGQYKTNVGFRVRAVDQSGNASVWTTRTFGTDLDPSQPDAPILIKDTTDPARTLLFVRHDLMKQDGTGRLETDVNRLKIYSTNTASSTPTVSGSDLIGTMMVNGNSVFAVSGTMDISPWSSKHFFVVAVDIAGNESDPSPTAPVSGASTGLYADVAYISVAYIDHLEANRIIAGSGFIDTIQVKSSLIVGATRDASAPSDADGNGVPITQSVVRSSDYKLGETGWIIRGDGYAEFRNLAVNSLNIGKFDQVTQSVMSTKFADFMEDPELWGRHTTTGNEEETGGTPYDAGGSFAGESNADGAYSARAMLDLTGLTSIRRKSSGLNRGISYEPGAVYKIWARVRQLTGPLTNAVNNPTFRGDVANAATGDTASDNVANFWREYSTITATKSLAAGVVGPAGTGITTAQRASGTIAANGHVGFRANTPLLTSGSPNQNALPVAAGFQYNLSAYFRPNTIPGTGTAYVAIEWYDAAGTLLSTSTEASNTIGAGVWLRVDNTQTAPAGAAIAAPRIRFAGSSAGSINVDFTGVQFTQTATVQPYFDGRLTNYAWSGDADASPSYSTDTTKYRVGVLGFDDSGNLCAADGSTSADPEDHYMVAADGTTELPVFDGTNSQSAGWTEVIGYVKDRTDDTTAPGAHNDPYDPAGVHKNVRFIVPFVQMNINDNGTTTNYIAQLDMFSIESSNTLAPLTLKTGISKGITVEDIQGDDWSHAIRFYSGNDDETYPGLITEIQDADFNSTHSLIIAPPQTILGDRTSLSEGMRIRGRNTNLLSNSSFENAYTAISTNADFENIKFSIGFINASRSWDNVNFHQGWGERSLQMTSVTTGYSFFWHHLMAYKFPELIGQTKLTVSAWVRNGVNVARNTGFFITTYDDTGANTSAMPGISTLTNASLVPGDQQWYRVSQTFDFSAIFPNGFPDNTNIWEIGFGWTATGAGEVYNFDDIQLEIGDTLTDYKPQAPTSYYLAGSGGMIINNSLVISDRIKSFDEMTNVRWNPQLDYEAANPSVQLENDGMVGIIEKFAGLNIVNSVNESYMAMRVLDDQGVIQGPWMQIKDSNDETNPNTLQFLNQSRGLIGYMGSMADPTNPEANANGSDLVIYGGFRAAGNPLWSAPNSLGTNVSNASGLYGFSSFNSNGTTYLRGSLNSVAGTSAGAALAVIPVEHRPQQNVDFVAGKLTGGAPAMVVCQIDTTGTLRVIRGAFTGLAAGEILLFDGLSFSTANATPVVSGSGGNPATIGAASQPLSFTLAPYASSLTTGTYRLSWTNVNDADNAKLRIVWRVDRQPASATDGNVVIVSTVKNSAQSYLLSGLPVGRRIYIKLFAVNKAGVINSTSPPSNSRFLLASPTVVYASSTASYRDGYGGMWRNDGDQLYQGEWTGNDNHRGVIFYGTQISTRLNTGGVARVPTKMQIYLQRTGSGGIYGGVGIDLFPTTLASKPAGAPSVVTSQTGGVNISYLKPNQGATITLPSLWYPIYTSGTYKGFAIYNTGSDYAILYGRKTNSAHGRLTIYHKG